MSRHKVAYVISYHGTLCHDMSYVTTIVASLLGLRVGNKTRLNFVNCLQNVITYRSSIIKK